MPGKPSTVKQYLASLPADRREALQAVREVILANIDSAYEEGIQYGMLGYYVPHSVYPPGYHCDPKQPLPYMSMASQKNYMSLYLCGVYASEDEQRRFREAWLKTGKKLDMGKSCVRFKKIEDVPLAVIADVVRRSPAKKFIANYEKALAAPRTRPAGAHKKKVTTKKTAVKKTAAKKAPRR